MNNDINIHVSVITNASYWIDYIMCHPEISDTEIDRIIKEEIKVELFDKARLN